MTKVADIAPNPFQPRQSFDPEGLEELAASIRVHGVLQPVVLRRTAGGLELVAGERRWRAAKKAGLEMIPAIVREDVSDSEMLELALVENVQRRALDPIEKARGFSALMERLTLTQEQVADKVGLKRSTVTNHLRLLTLPEHAQVALSSGRISMGHARALVGLPDDDTVAQIVHRIEQEGLSVRQVEQLVRQLSTIDAETPAPRRADQLAASDVIPAWVKTLEDRLRHSLGTKAEIHNGPEFRGQIVVEYYGRKDLERLMAQLAPEQSLE